MVFEFAETALLEGPPSEKLSALVNRRLNEKPELSYSQAFSEVQLENRELADAYINELYELE